METTRQQKIAKQIQKDVAEIFQQQVQQLFQQGAFGAGGRKGSVRAGRFIRTAFTFRQSIQQVIQGHQTPAAADAAFQTAQQGAQAFSP